MVELIITEKPKAAEKIAKALADGKAIKENIGGVAFYKVTHGNKDLLVGSAVGHLFGLKQREQGWSIPQFDIEWVPSYEVSKRSDFSKKYVNALRKLVKMADEFTVATDYDIEGEVIGLNVVRYICKKEDANRMKFSTLTKPDIVKAYENKSKTLDWGQAKAGDTRHKLDWFYGINTSRALSNAIRSTGMYKIMSTGRVQGPALKLVVDKEKTIQAFKSTPYWQIELSGLIKTSPLIAWHKVDKFWDKEEAQKSYDICKLEKKAIVESIKTSQTQQAPPFPFDLTSLQIEAHKCLGISPKQTLSLAQELYTAGYISYPRTSSQQLPKEIGYKNIIIELGKQPNYIEESKFLLAKKALTPNNGKKTDAAHPAIYPTGILPKIDEPREFKLYDLITRRFLATFGDPATRETMKITLDCKKENFIAKGTRTTVKGWHDLYGRYVMLKDEELPEVKEKDEIAVEKITFHSKETSPPKRFTEASIIKDLEKRGLGTKATRATIVDTLFQRNYIGGKPIQATELGIKTLNTLEKYNPKIVNEEMTRGFEEQMDLIREDKIEPEEVLKNAKATVTEIIEVFKKHQKEIGNELKQAEFKTMNKDSYMGKCLKCKDGDLHLKKGKFGNFIACNQYPECKTTFSMPNKGKFKYAEKECEHCKHSIIKILAGKRSREVCINPNCSGKVIEDEKVAKEVSDLEKGLIEKKCPKCNKGNMVLRNSLYGKFLGCSNYPKCKNTERLSSAPQKEKTEGEADSKKAQVEPEEKKPENAKTANKKTVKAKSVKKTITKK